MTKHVIWKHLLDVGKTNIINVPRGARLLMGAHVQTFRHYKHSHGEMIAVYTTHEGSITSPDEQTMVLKVVMTGEVFEAGGFTHVGTVAHEGIVAHVLLLTGEP